MGSSKKKKKKTPGLLADNRKARFLYTIEDRLECGIELVGTEVKSIKKADFNFSDSYVEIESGELWMRNFHVTPYSLAGVFNHTAERPRRLLAHKKEIMKLDRRVTEKGCTLIPLKFYISKGYVKVEVGLCRGKKLHDRRRTIQLRDNQRDLEREHKYRT